MDRRVIAMQAPKEKKARGLLDNSTRPAGCYRTPTPV